MKCMACSNWNLKDSPLRAYGFGLCKKEADPLFYKARTYSLRAKCNKDQFEQASAEVMERRRINLKGAK